MIFYYITFKNDIYVIFLPTPVQQTLLQPPNAEPPTEENVV